MVRQENALKEEAESKKDMNEAVLKLLLGGRYMFVRKTASLLEKDNGKVPFLCQAHRSALTMQRHCHEYEQWGTTNKCLTYCSLLKTDRLIETKAKHGLWFIRLATTDRGRSEKRRSNSGSTADTAEPTYGYEQARRWREYSKQQQNDWQPVTAQVNH